MRSYTSKIKKREKDNIIFKDFELPLKHKFASTSSID